MIRRLSGVDFAWDKEKLWTLTGSNGSAVCVGIFDFYVFSAEKYAIDAYLNDAASGYFNIIFMPTSMINLAAGFVDPSSADGINGRMERTGLGEV